MGKRNQQEMDFDRWADMAKCKPEMFEAMRQEVIDEAIDAASPERQRQLRRLQWRIDQERRRSGSSMGACIRISHMMWESLSGNGGLLDRLDDLKMTISRPTSLPVRYPKAPVISFPQRRS